MSDSNVREWNELFGTVLRDSPVRITSGTLAQGVSRRLERTSRRSISKALVQKWRLVGKRRFVPSDREVTEALVSTLNEYGAFQDDDISRQRRDGLFKLLGYEPRPDVGEIIKNNLRQASCQYADLFAKGGDITGLTQSETKLVISCLLSQLAWHEDFEKLKEKGSGGVLLVFLLWDAGADTLAQFFRNSLFEELDDNDVLSFLQGASSSVKVNITFGVLGSEDTLDSTRIDELQAIKHRLRGEHTGITVRSPHWDLTLWSAHDVWVHLHPDGSFRGWRMIRHPDLFKKLQDTTASTIASPLDEGTLARFLNALKVQCVLPGHEWVIDPGNEMRQVGDDGQS